MIFNAVKLCFVLSFVKNYNFVAVYQRVTKDWSIDTYAEDRKFYRIIMNGSMRNGEIFLASLLKYKSTLQGYLKVLKTNFSAVGDFTKDFVERGTPISLTTNILKDDIKERFKWNETDIRKLGKLLSELIKVFQDCCTVILRVTYRM